MASTQPELKWSAQFLVAYIGKSTRLHGDKITLPPSALEALLAAAPIVSVESTRNVPHTSNFDPYNHYTYAAERQMREQLADRQQQLPQPLTFRIVNPRNERVVYAGIREFSAEEGTIGLSNFLQDALGLEDTVSETQWGEEVSVGNGNIPTTEEVLPIRKDTQITVHFKELPKGSYVRLRPLEAGYDPEDWKSLLERYLRDNFTTMTNGEILDVRAGRSDNFRFLIDKFMPEGDGICIVDTDLEVDIEPLNEEQARETLRRRLEKSERTPNSREGSSKGGTLILGQEYAGQVVPGDYVDFEIKDWGNAGLAVELQADNEAELDLFLNPFSARQRARPRDDEHILADFDSRPTKRLRLGPSNVELEGAEAIYISVHGYQSEQRDNNTLTSPAPRSFILRTSIGTEDPEWPSAEADTSLPSEDEVKCKNCQQFIPKRTMPLHEAYCYRNNILCSKCHQVFQKRSPEWEAHWHCPHDSSYGNSSTSKQKHDQIYHPLTPYDCPSCSDLASDDETTTFSSLPSLALHRVTSCPSKLILCQFCHLLVPQRSPEEPSFSEPEVLLSGLTPHELADGSRTTECHLCSRIVRLRDMKTHLKHHDLDRLSRPTPLLCSNKMCGHTIPLKDQHSVSTDQLGLCNPCFGPLYASQYDPSGKALRRRIERRLLTQVMSGCGKSWCKNQYLCRTGKKNLTGEDKVVNTKDALTIVKPVIANLNNTAGDDNSRRPSSSNQEEPTLSFCTDENNQTRRILAETLSETEQYELPWCVKALEESSSTSTGPSKIDLDKTGTWLRDWAPRKGERERKY
ncbi:putative ubiquitin fusion degradation protein [Phaeomoniella chlamydospora]|uniref:Putative ubiquitin fusion degradation protein n=1 Tax=Phaeomoniella chlamydospora TaxID=158046 RepID=A0A0G2GSM6_PHACM|nr:putative ubiquitin fusion degradation protein [Phaeomoniella chlamydospora]